MAPTKDGEVYVGVDVGIKNDSTGIVALRPESDPVTGEKRWRMVFHRIMKPTPGTAVKHSDIAAALRWLHQSFNVRKIGVDPSQALELITYLRGEGLPIEEVPQTTSTVDEMGVTLYTAIQSRSLRVYPDADLRQQALNVVAVEKPDGMMRMDKAKSGRKIDAVVALAIALRAATVVPPSWAPFAWSVHHTTDGAMERLMGTRGQEVAVRNPSSGRMERYSTPHWADAPEGASGPAHCRCGLPISDPERVYYGCHWNADSGTERKRRLEARDFEEAVKRGWTLESAGWSPR